MAVNIALSIGLYKTNVKLISVTDELATATTIENSNANQSVSKNETESNDLPTSNYDNQSQNTNVSNIAPTSSSLNNIGDNEPISENNEVTDDASSSMDINPYAGHWYFKYYEFLIENDGTFYKVKWSETQNGSKTMESAIKGKLEGVDFIKLKEADVTYVRNIYELRYKSNDDLIDYDPSKYNYEEEYVSELTDDEKLVICNYTKNIRAYGRDTSYEPTDVQNTLEYAGHWYFKNYEFLIQNDGTFYKLIWSKTEGTPKTIELALMGTLNGNIFTFEGQADVTSISSIYDMPSLSESDYTIYYQRETEEIYEVETDILFICNYTNNLRAYSKE